MRFLCLLNILMLFAVTALWGNAPQVNRLQVPKGFEDRVVLPEKSMSDRQTEFLRDAFKQYKADSNILFSKYFVNDMGQIDINTLSATEKKEYVKIRTRMRNFEDYMENQKRLSKVEDRNAVKEERAKLGKWYKADEKHRGYFEFEANANFARDAEYYRILHEHKGEMNQRDIKNQMFDEIDAIRESRRSMDRKRNEKILRDRKARGDYSADDNSETLDRLNPMVRLHEGGKLRGTGNLYELPDFQYNINDGFLHSSYMQLGMNQATGIYFQDLNKLREAEKARIAAMDAKKAAAAARDSDSWFDRLLSRVRD